MIKRLLYGTLVLLLMGIEAGTANAQQAVGSHPLWIVIGVGRAEPLPSANVNLSYNFQPGKNAYHVAIEYTGDIPLMGGDPRYYTAALNTGIGKRWIRRYTQFAQFIGPALTYSKKTRGDQVLRSFSPGLAANLQFYMKPLVFIIPEVGLGIDLFGTLNVSRSFFGVRASFMMNNAR